MAKKKGKAQNGRAKQKHKAQNGGTPRSAPRSFRNNVSQQMLDDDDHDWGDDTAVRFRGFSQTSSAPAPTPSMHAKLRHQAISFVSAGLNASLANKPSADEDAVADESETADGDDDEEDDDDEADDVDDSNIQTNIVLDADIQVSENSMARMSIETLAEANTMKIDPDTTTLESGVRDTEAHCATATSSEALPFVVDTVGDATLLSGLRIHEKQQVKTSSTSSPSDSGDEVVVFHGRKNITVRDDPVLPRPGPSQSSSQQPTERTTASADPFSVRVIGWGAQPSKYDTSQQPDSVWSPAPSTPYWRKGKGKAIPHPDFAPSSKEVKVLEDIPMRQSRVQFVDEVVETAEAAATNESVETLQADLKKALKEKQAAKKSKIETRTDVGQGSKQATSKGSRRGSRSARRRQQRAVQAAVESDEGLSGAACDDYMENVKAQLEEDGEEEDLITLLSDHSNAIGGPSMVVDGEEIDDDQILPIHKTLKSVDDSGKWDTDDSSANPDLDELSSEESLNASDLEDMLEYTEREQWEDEEDLRQRRIDRMDDEHIARLLAKQEELGMGSDEILIEDGDYPHASDDGFGDLLAARAGLRDLTNSSGHRGNKHDLHTRRPDKKHNYPDASTMADAIEQYGGDGFDIMDFDRPSLRNTRNGRRGNLPPELEFLSDEEMKENIIEQWEKDRGKKRQKKLEREELRAEGLLGSAGRKGRANLHQKYPFGMSIKHVWTELEAFLRDDDLRERAFPPMDKSDRKVLHEVANALNIVSKSQGSGNYRFAILYKTSRTRGFSSDEFARILRASSRGYLGNPGKAKKMAKGGKVAGGGRGGGVDAATIRNGEVVGAGAAEIGTESFGHKLMERMGWSKGMALGKDGEGLLVPVEQRMRRGTAGLG